MKYRAYEIAINSQYNGYQKGMPNIIYIVFDKKKKKKEETDANVNEVLPQELHKPLIKKIKGNNVLTRYKDNISEADLAEMGSLSSFNHGV